MTVYSWELKSWVVFVTELGPSVSGALQCTPEMFVEMRSMMEAGHSRAQVLEEVMGRAVSGPRGPK